MNDQRAVVRTINTTPGERIQFRFSPALMDAVSITRTDLNRQNTVSVEGTYIRDMQSAKAYFDSDPSIHKHDKELLLLAIEDLFPNEKCKRNPEVLFVDDEEVTRRYFQRYYGSTMSVICAGSVDEALELLQIHGGSLRVLVTDQRMPGRGGTDLLCIAREKYPHISRLLCTAHSDNAETIKAINEGGLQGYLAKPFCGETWTGRLHEALQEGRRSWEEGVLLKLELKAMLEELPRKRVLSLKTMCRVLVGREIDAAVDAYAAAGERVNTAGTPRINWDRYDFSTLETRESERVGILGYVVAGLLPQVKNITEPTDLATRFPDVFRVGLGGLYLQSETALSGVIFDAPECDITFAQSTLFAVMLSNAMRGSAMTWHAEAEGTRIGF